MKQLKKGIALLLTLSTVFALSVSASATEFTLVKSNSKSANVGTTATITGEVWNVSVKCSGGLKVTRENERIPPYRT